MAGWRKIILTIRARSLKNNHHSIVVDCSEARSLRWVRNQRCMLMFFNLMSNHFGSRLYRRTRISVNSKPMPIPLLQIIVKPEAFTISSHCCCCCCWDWDQLVGLVVLLVTVHILRKPDLSTLLLRAFDFMSNRKKWRNRKIYNI